MQLLEVRAQVGAAEPVKLTVGYQPYDTISYSAVVIRALELWKKYLPPGSVPRRNLASSHRAESSALATAVQ